MPDIDTSVITQQGIDALTARAPKGALITGVWDGKAHSWVWSIQMSDPAAKAGVSRQFTSTNVKFAPTASDFDLMITEMLSTLGGTA